MMMDHSLLVMKLLMVHLKRKQEVLIVLYVENMVMLIQMVIKENLHMFLVILVIQIIQMVQKKNQNVQKKIVMKIFHRTKIIQNNDQFQ